MRLGAEAAAELAAIPDTPELAAIDRSFTARHPLAADALPGPLVRQMRRLVARYRDECGVDWLIIQLEIAEAYANCLASHPPVIATQARTPPDLCQQDQAAGGELLNQRL